MQLNNTIQNWVLSLDRRLYAIIIGIAIGIIAGIFAILLIKVDTMITFGLVLGLLGGLYIISDVHIALYGLIFTLFLLPFGTLPFSIGFTPTLIDLTIGTFVLVYLLMWMTGERRSLQLTPVHILVSVYLIWLIVAFALGLRHSPPTMLNLRQFAETILSILLVFILVDLFRTPKALQRLTLVILIAVGAQSLIVLGLYALPDDVTETFLIQFVRIGYPDSGIIRYIESNPALGERAIGTWVDPNTLGGILATSAVMLAPQIFARRPVLKYRWLTIGVIGLIALALVLTFSRASMLAMAIGLGVLAFIRYRRFIPILVIAGMLFLFLPQTQAYVQRFAEAFTGADLATQMRLGEYSDSLRLIQRYPIFGVGFTGTPDIDIYTDVASMYLIMANQIGLVGVIIFLATISGVFLYGIHAWRYAKNNPQLEAVHLGFHIALITALANGVADLYFFRLDFQGSITLFWITVALAITSSYLALQSESIQQNTNIELTVVKNQDIH